MTQPNPYDIAASRLAEIEKEREELRAFLATRSTFDRLLSGQVDDTVTRSGVFRSPGSLVATVMVERRPSSRAVVDAALNVIIERNRPIPLGELYRALVAAGVEIGGKDPRNNLSAKLYADPRVETLPKLGWWKVGEPLPLNVRLEEHFENEEGPAANAAEPLQMNGAAVGAA